MDSSDGIMRRETMDEFGEILLRWISFNLTRLVRFSGIFGCCS